MALGAPGTLWRRMREEQLIHIDRRKVNNVRSYKRQGDAGMREWIANFTMEAFGFMLPFAILAFGLSILLLPVAAWRRTRGFALVCMFILTIVCGITTWLYGAACTFMAWGWVGLIVGLALMGVGVVPLAMVASLFKSDVPISVFWILLAMSAATFLLRATTAYFASKD